MPGFVGRGILRIDGTHAHAVVYDVLADDDPVVFSSKKRANALKRFLLAISSWVLTGQGWHSRC
jgi:hypothetical protein